MVGFEKPPRRVSRTRMFSAGANSAFTGSFMGMRICSMKLGLLPVGFLLADVDFVTLACARSPTSNSMNGM